MYRFLKQFFLGEIQPGKDPLADRSYLVNNENFHALFQPIARSVRAGSRFILLLSSRAFRMMSRFLKQFFLGEIQPGKDPLADRELPG